MGKAFLAIIGLLFGGAIAAGAMAGILAISMLISFAIGSVFDAAMGTNATPIFVMAGIVLGMSSDYFGYAKLDFSSMVVTAIVTPLVALLGAWVVNWMFPALAVSFMAMINFDGSLYELTFWGSSMVVAMRVILGIVLAAIVGSVKKG